MKEAIEIVSAPMSAPKKPHSPTTQFSETKTLFESSHAERSSDIHQNWNYRIRNLRSTTSLLVQLTGIPGGQNFGSWKALLGVSDGNIKQCDDMFLP
jgi:hypothetical protein